MNIENPTEILEWDINKLWNAFQQIQEETNNAYNKEEQQIKNGIKINIPIHYINNNWYEHYPSTKKTQVNGHGKFDIITIQDEIDKRKILLRKIILANLKDENPIQPR